MFLTKRLNAAVIFAAKKHDGQLRKVDKYPFIIHPFSVASILIAYQADEDTVIAGLLHDTLEDTDCSEEEILRAFGSKVLEIVKAVSEDKSLKWKQRKIGYIEHLKIASEEALMVSCADKVHNLHSLIDEHESKGESVWGTFNKGKDETLWFFDAVFEVLENRLENEIINEYKDLILKSKQLFY